MKFTLLTVGAVAIALIAGKILLPPTKSVPTEPPVTQTNSAIESAYVGDHRASLDLPELGIGENNSKKFSFGVDTVNEGDLFPENLNGDLSTRQTVDNISLFDEPISDRENDTENVQPSMLSDL